VVEILAESEVVESCTLGILFRFIKGVVLVYKMLWDWKKILNINLWRIIRLSMRLAMGLCPHISVEKILIYTVLI